MRETVEFNDLIDFTLDYYGKSAFYKVLYLNREEYAECLIGQRQYMNIGKIFLIENLKFLHGFYKDYPEYYSNYKNHIKELKPSDDVEYGRIMKINEIVNTPASCVQLDDLEDLESPFPFAIIEDEYSTFFQIKRMNKQVKFIIILREDLFLTQKENKQFSDIIHEAFHIVEHLCEKRYNSNDLDKIVLKILNEYQKYKYGF